MAVKEDLANKKSFKLEIPELWGHLIGAVLSEEADEGEMSEGED